MRKALLALIVLLSLAFPVAPPTASAATSSTATVTRPLLVVVTSFNDSVVTLSEKDMATIVFGSKHFRNGVADFYLDQSMGRMSLVSANESWGKKDDGIISVTLKEESPPEFIGKTFVEMNRLARKALIAADNFVNFRGFDKDSSGRITNGELTIIIVFSINFRAHYALLSHIVLDGVVIGNGASPLSNEGLVLMPAFDMDPSALISVMRHEIGHSFGLPDLYGENNPLPGQSLSLMGTGNELDAWSMRRLGWIDSRVVTPGEYRLPAGNEALIVKSPISTAEIIIENRRGRGVVIYSYYPSDNYPDGYQPISVCNNRYWNDEFRNDSWCVFANSASIVQLVSRKGVSSALFDYPTNVNVHGLSITVLDPAGDVMRIKIEEAYSSSSEKG